MERDVKDTASDTAVVRAWHDALNSGDVDRLAALVHDDVELGGPRGSGRGVALVRDWVERAGIQLEPERWFQGDGVIVVVQRARWRSSDTGELGAPQEVASVFQIRNGLVCRVMRYDTRREALDTVGLDESAEVRPLPSAANMNQEAAAMPHVIARNALPYVGSSHELEGFLHGGAPVSLIFFDGPPGSGPRLHRHPYAEIFVIQEGSATFTVGDETIEVTAGQIVVGPAGVPHKFVNTGDGPLRQLDIHTNDRFITEWMEE